MFFMVIKPAVPSPSAPERMTPMIRSRKIRRRIAKADRLPGTIIKNNENGNRNVPGQDGS
jgi:hypothetical protein